MKNILAVVLLSFCCVFSQPVFADTKKSVAEIEKEQLELRIRYLCERTEKLEDRVRKENKTNHAQSAKRVDREYLSKLKKVARRGDVNLWDLVYMEYMNKRSKALEKDKKTYEQKEAEKRKNPWYNPSGLNE